MASCRDCKTCTNRGIVYWTQLAAAFTAHCMSGFISWFIKRGFYKHCPQCKHLLSRHARRADGSFLD